MNCPKCGFYQPEDQYCASCGVDMEKYQPKEAPVWRRVLGNWIFQLAVLMVVVIGLIISDNMSSEKRVITDRSLPLSAPVKASKSRAADGRVLPPPVKEGATPVAPPPMPGAAKQIATQNSAMESPSAVTRSEESAVNEIQNKEIKKSKTQTTAASMKRTVASYFYLVSRETFDALTSTSGTPVEDGFTLLKSKDFSKELKTRRSDWKKLASQRQSFEFETSKLIFVGSTAGESTAKIGYYIRGLVYRPDENQKKLNVELRTWSELKPGAESLGGPSTAIEMDPKEIIMISNIVPRDLNFTDAERADFEGHPTLQALNDPQYIDGNLELVLVLQYK